MTLPAASKISQIYDFMVAKAKTALQTHQELVDFDDLLENPAPILDAGYGVQVGNGRDTEREICSTHYYYEREFVLILTREVTALKSDVETRKKKHKQILEDYHQFKKLVEGTHTALADDGTELSFNVKYASDSGPRTFSAHDKEYIFLEATITAEYLERL